MSRTGGMVVAGLLITLSLTGASASAARLDVRLARERFVEGEPILVEAGVICEAADGRCYASTQRGNVGAVVFHLFRQAEGGEGREVEVPQAYSAEHDPRAAELELGAMDEFWEVTDLNPIFGEYRRGEGSIADRLGAAALPPGQYRLHGFARLKGAGRGEADSVLSCEGGDLGFTVVPIEVDAEAERLVGDFLSNATFAENDYAARADHCARWLPRFYGSGFFPVVFLASGRHMTDEGLEKLLKRMREAHGHPLTRGAVLDIRMRIDRIGDGAKRSRLTKLMREEKDGTMARMMKTWARKLVQQKGYESFGP